MAPAVWHSGQCVHCTAAYLCSLWMPAFYTWNKVTAFVSCEQAVWPKTAAQKDNLHLNHKRVWPGDSWPRGTILLQVLVRSVFTAVFRNCSKKKKSTWLWTNRDVRTKPEMATDVTAGNTDDKGWVQIIEFQKKNKMKISYFQKQKMTSVSFWKVNADLYHV